MISSPIGIEPLGSARTLFNSTSAFGEAKASLPFEAAAVELESWPEGLLP